VVDLDETELPNPDVSDLVDFRRELKNGEDDDVSASKGKGKGGSNGSKGSKGDDNDPDATEEPTAAPTQESDEPNLGDDDDSGDDEPTAAPTSDCGKGSSKGSKGSKGGDDDYGSKGKGKGSSKSSKGSKGDDYDDDDDTEEPTAAPTKRSQTSQIRVTTMMTRSFTHQRRNRQRPRHQTMARAAQRVRKVPRGMTMIIARRAKERVARRAPRDLKVMMMMLRTQKNRLLYQQRSQTSQIRVTTMTMVMMTMTKRFTHQRWNQRRPRLQTTARAVQRVRKVPRGMTMIIAPRAKARVARRAPREVTMTTMTTVQKSRLLHQPK
jgi:hypothetical protein